jgi:hypothetical protein
MSVSQREYPILKGEDAKRFLENEKEVDKLRVEMVKTWIEKNGHWAIVDFEAENELRRTIGMEELKEEDEWD